MDEEEKVVDLFENEEKELKDVLEKVFEEAEDFMMVFSREDGSVGVATSKVSLKDCLVLQKYFNMLIDNYVTMALTRGRVQ